MDTRLNHPELAGSFEQSPPARARWWCWVCLGAWLLLLAVDWTARFRHFRWQDQWRIARPAAPAAPRTEVAFRSRTVPARTGAGLTHLIPVPHVAARYAEFHAGHVITRDRWGYANDPLPDGEFHRIVMLGDSFLESLGTQNVAQVLASIGEVPVYNHARAASGPFLELQNFLMSPRLSPPPDVVIWNLSGRELGASLFLRQPIEAWFEQVDVWAERRAQRARSRIRWDRLTPEALGRSWPNTSVIAYFNRQSWARLKLVVFQAWPDEVVGADDPVFGPMLFYGPNLRVLPELSAERDASAVVQTVMKAARRFRGRGQTLVILLVPEKEQVHARALPEPLRKALAEGPELFAAIASGLESEGVAVVNLMPVFQAATAEGRRLYWRDDTHWNDAGIRLAAEEIWRVVGPLMEREQGTEDRDRSQ